MTVDDQLERCGPPAFVIRTPYLRGYRFEGRPIGKEPPPPFAVSIMYRREGPYFKQAGVGAFKDGKWTNGKGRELDPANLHWTAMVDER